MKKTIAFKTPKPATGDQWVQGAKTLDHREAAGAGPMKRLTIDVSVELHQRIKRHCVDHRLKMADFVRELLERQCSKG